MRELYRQHIDRLEREVGAAVAGAGYDELIVHSGAESPRSPFDDQYWPFRPTPAFAHWLHLPAPGCAVSLRPGERPRLYRAAHESFWDAAPAEPDDWMLEPFEVIDGPVEPGAGRIAFIGDDPEAGAALGLEAPRAAINPPALLAALDAIRAIKSDYEIECIAEANRIAAFGHQSVAEQFDHYALSELELHLSYLRVTGQDDADTPYKNIVARDRNAAVLHHVRYSNEQPRMGESSLLIDAGATVRGYAADVTRTHCRGGAGDFGSLIDAIEMLQREVIDMIAPRMSYEELHDRSHVLLAEVLRELGIARGSDDELVGGGVTRSFFPHGLGHSIGVQVHDVGCRPRAPAPRNPYLRHTADIEPGQVFTIEPGCYFIDSLLGPLREGPRGGAVSWSRVEALYPLGGVRIEDNIAVTGSGTRNLTRDKPSESS